MPGTLLAPSELLLLFILRKKNSRLVVGKMHELETEDCSSQDGHTREVASSLGADSGSAVLRHLLWTQMAWRGFPGLPAPEQVSSCLECLPSPRLLKHCMCFLLVQVATPSYENQRCLQTSPNVPRV
ncbi:hypothetical protein mRhiFer1_010259 [Rhinolophus ferrumequinum]|uniref:Uncharacterized protein n=1 Tax=Rhinolophus ferrumequinum TaxID=59479 RepID=A0A7J7X5D7_RHIFE|nr:hypothetical protein mRhiFer1_010259 [Rhinolophus ferrumequinum]